MRLSLGNAVAIAVTATELWYANLRGGRCFVRGVNLVASPGNFSEIQILNPVGSGVQAIVRAFIPSQGANSNMESRRFDTALVTDVGTLFNLLAGGAASACHLRTAQPAAADGTLLTTFSLLATTPFQPAPDWFTELSPGQGVILVPGGANIQNTVSFSLMENPQ